MSATHRNEILKRFMLSIWGIVTLILVFCIALLINEMIKSGQDPLNAFTNQNAQVTAKSTQNKPTTIRKTQQILLYFASNDARTLVAEKQQIEFTDTLIENCRATLQNLIAGPQTNLTPILPPSTKIRGLYLLENGEMVIDFSRELISQHARTKSATLESLMIYGIVNTLTQTNLQQETANNIQSIRFLFEGAPPQENFPAHIDLSEPIEPNNEWLPARPERFAHD